MPIDEILFEAEEHMEKALDHLKHEMRGLRTGRATTALVEYVKIDYYGTPTDLRARWLQADHAGYLQHPYQTLRSQFDQGCHPRAGGSEPGDQPAIRRQDDSHGPAGVISGTPAATGDQGQRSLRAYTHFTAQHPPRCQQKSGQ